MTLQQRKNVVLSLYSFYSNNLDERKVLDLDNFLIAGRILSKNEYDRLRYMMFYTQMINDKCTLDEKEMSEDLLFLYCFAQRRKSLNQHDFKDYIKFLVGRDSA